MRNTESDHLTLPHICECENSYKEYRGIYECAEGVVQMETEWMHARCKFSNKRNKNIVTSCDHALWV